MYLTDGPPDAKHTCILAHGAGAPMTSPMLTTIARLLGERGIRVVRFEFPYMEQRRKGPPDRQPVLLDTWRRVVGEHGGGAGLVIGGHSMGGRMASMIADEVGARALVCFSYPWHPPGKPEQPRTAHLADLRTPTLILQGTRDPFGSPEEVQTYSLSPSIRVEWLDGGGHSLRGRVPGGGSGRIVHFRTKLQIFLLAVALDLLLELVPDLRPHVLVVEDDIGTREALRKILEAEGCSVEVAPDGEKAIGCLAQRKYDVIVLDLALPKLSGTDIMEYIASTDPAQLSTIVVVTGLEAFEIRKLFPAVRETLSKPVMPSRLIASVRRCLGATAHPNGLSGISVA